MSISDIVAQSTKPLLAELVKLDASASITSTTGDQINVMAKGVEHSVTFSSHRVETRKFSREYVDKVTAKVMCRSTFNSRKFVGLKAGGFNFAAMASEIIGYANHANYAAEKAARYAANKEENKDLLARCDSLPLVAYPSELAGKAIRVRHSIDGNYTAPQVERLLAFLATWPAEKEEAA